jgi:hypothetical protein
LVDPKAMQRLEEAAEAAGLETVEDLVNLVFDSGAAAMPPTEQPESFTMEDLGERLHSQVPLAQADRADWFEGLVETQQLALVALLRARGNSSVVISNDFGLEVKSVSDIYARYADNLGAQVVNVRLNTLVGNLQLAAERAAEGSMRKKDWSTYWRIYKEMIAIMQSLGIVKQAIRKVEVAHKFDDQKAAEVDALLAIERKQLARREELKLIQANVTDPVPVPASLELEQGSLLSMGQPFDD